MSRDALALLRARVHEDPVLARTLSSLDADRFVATVVRMAFDLGFEIDEADIAQASAEQSLAWSMRWIE